MRDYVDSVIDRVTSEPIGEKTTFIYWDSNSGDAGPEGGLHLAAWWWSADVDYLLKAFLSLQLSVDIGKRFGAEEDGTGSDPLCVIEYAKSLQTTKRDLHLLLKIESWIRRVEDTKGCDRIKAFNELGTVLKGTRIRLKATMFISVQEAKKLLKTHGVDFKNGSIKDSFLADQLCDA